MQKKADLLAKIYRLFPFVTVAPAALFPLVLCDLVFAFLFD
jgi:hypothetical protein